MSDYYSFYDYPLEYIIYDIDGTLINSFYLGYICILEYIKNNNNILKRYNIEENNSIDCGIKIDNSSVNIICEDNKEGKDDNGAHKSNHTNISSILPIIDNILPYSKYVLLFKYNNNSIDFILKTLLNIDPIEDEELYHLEYSNISIELNRLYIKNMDVLNVPLYNGIHELISDCKKYSIDCLALTNGESLYGNLALKITNILPFFLIVHGSDEVEAIKPSPLGILKCCNELKVSPRVGLFIGDSPSDGKAAKSAGMRAIGVTWGSHTKQEMIDCKYFDMLVDTVDELRNIIETFHSKRDHFYY